MRRRVKRQTAKLGFLTAEGATAKEAKLNLAVMVDWACHAPSATIENRYGFLIVVAANPTGFDVFMFDPAELAHGKRRECRTSHGQIAYTDALLSGRMHAAQNAWSADVASDAEHIALAGLTESKARDLASWIAFQRRYIAEKANGATNNEAFDRANGIQAVAS